MWFFRCMLKTSSADLLSEIGRRYFDTVRQSNQIREQNITSSQDYYENIIEQNKIERLTRTPWIELWNWVQQVVVPQLPLLDYFHHQKIEQYISNIRYNAEKTYEDPQKENFDNFIDDDVIEFYLDRNNIEAVEKILEQNNIPNWWVKTPTGKEIFLFEYDNIWVVEQDKNGQVFYSKNSHEWIEEAADRSFEYIPEEDFTEVYWSSVGSHDKLYHATREEYVPLIMKHGLEARSDTRGLENRYMPSAVFTVPQDDIDGMSLSYGPSIIEINLGAMKSDGYMPEMMEEEPVSECNIKMALAHLIGDESYETDCSGDYHPNTIAILGDIPPKYLRVVN